MEANKMEIQVSAFSLPELLRSIQDLLMVKSQEKHVDLVFSKDAHVPDIFRGDPLRLAQVCVNICSNALKFTDSGSVRLNVALPPDNLAEIGYPDSQNPHLPNTTTADSESLLLLFTITDTGIGISPEDQQRIFESFSQADGSNTRKYGGTGLGLAISKSLVRLMGGDIWLESEVGRGSTFSFLVRVEHASPEDLAQVESPPPPEEEVKLPPLKVLLAEDNEMNQIIALEILKGMGIEPRVAQNGEEAVRLWESEPFDLILMDIQMPLLDGLSAARKIRASNRQNANLPIIAMTANAMAGDREKSLEAGMNDHITKPLDVQELRNTLFFWSKPDQHT
jgi:two-component system sensor histidine kinase/response regulator